MALDDLPEPHQKAPRAGGPPMALAALLAVGFALSSSRAHAAEPGVQEARSLRQYVEQGPDPLDGDFSVALEAVNVDG